MGMSVERLHELYDLHAENGQFGFEGCCHDCETEVNVAVTATDDGFQITGGAVYEPAPQQQFLKCDACFTKKPRLTNFRNCEVYSRVVGYLRPVSQWNNGKQSEYGDRQVFDQSL